MLTQPTPDDAAAVLAIMKQWVEMRMAHGSLSPIVKHELATVLKIIREECDSRGVQSP